MLIKLRNRIKGQSTAEYAILIALVVAAVIAMQTYAKRALQAKVRDATIYMNNQTKDLGNTTQYEPYYLESQFDVTRSQNIAQVLGNNLTGMSGNQEIQRASGFQQFSYNGNKGE